MAFRVFGESDAGPMVLLHGGREDGTTWDAVVQQLSKRWQLYIPDLRGHGQSAAADAYSFELMREDVLSFLVQQGLEHVSLVGHSMGGVVAYLVAQEISIDFLVLEETPPPIPMGFPVPGHPIRGPIVQQLNNPDPMWWERISNIDAPTLVIAGGVRSFLPQDQIALMAKRFPLAELVTIDAGHAVHRRNPAEFAQAILSSSMLTRHDR